MIWHECPDCGAACGCAMEEECAHVCEPDENEALVDDVDEDEPGDEEA